MSTQTSGTTPIGELSTADLQALRTLELSRPIAVRRKLVARIDELLTEREAENARATAADWAAWHAQDQ